MGFWPCTDHPHTKITPPQQLSDTCTHFRTMRGQSRSESICEGESRLASLAKSALSPSPIFPARQVASLRPRSRWFLLGPIVGAGAVARPVAVGCVASSRHTQPPRSGRLKPGGRLVPGAAGVCGSLAAGHPFRQSPGGSRPAGAAVRRRVRGVWTPHPRAVCRSPSAPARASRRGPCVRTGS
jgi:hypothetical protein